MSHDLDAPPPLSAWRQAVLVEARSWIGTGWHHNARVKGAGVDCGQYLAAAYVGAGLVPAFDTGDYAADWMLHQSEERFLGWVQRFMDPVVSPSPADVVVWKYGHCYSHGAIVVEWPMVLHSYRREHGVVLGDASKGELARMRLSGGGSEPRPVLFFSFEGRLP